jgi:hypothetical protein
MKSPRRTLKGMVRRGVPRKIKALTTRYIWLLNDRRMTDAEKVLETIKRELKPNPLFRGYYNALEGMAMGLKSKDTRYLYINRMDLKDKKTLKNLQREFTKQSRNPRQDDFDRGFFMAWCEYIQALQSQEPSTETLTNYLSDE